MVGKLQHSYYRMPKVFIMNGQKQIGGFASIDQGVMRRFIKELARPYAERKFNLRFLYGRVLTDKGEVRTSHACSHVCLSFARSVARDMIWHHS